MPKIGATIQRDLGKGVAGKTKEVILPLLSALVKPILNAVASLGLPVQESYGLTGGSSAQGHQNG